MRDPFAQIFSEDAAGNVVGLPGGTFAIGRVSALAENRVELLVQRSFCKLTIQLCGAPLDSMSAAVNGHQVSLRPSQGDCGFFSFPLTQDLELHCVDLLIGATRYLR